MLTLQLSAYPHLLLLLSVGSTVLLLRTADDYASGCHCCKIFDMTTELAVRCALPLCA